MRNILVALIRLYQIIGVPFLRALTGSAGSCRFMPSCSNYAIEALKLHGSIGGSLLAAWRILRCNPWGGFGHDPVPPRRNGVWIEPERASSLPGLFLSPGQKDFPLVGRVPRSGKP